MPSELLGGGALPDALAKVGVPMVATDTEGRILWDNRAARDLFGDVVGTLAESLFAPQDRARMRRELARKVLGLAESTDYEATVVTADGRYLPVEVSSVVLRESHQVIGVFGVAIPDEAGEGAPAPHPDLSPRQHEVLLLLANGLSTAQIAEKLSIAPETVRNHIKAVLRALGAHSRLEAVARAHELGIV